MENYHIQPPKIDRNSIKTTTTLSFVAFAVILIFIVWMLASFFVDTYYSSMRTREAIQTAGSIEAQYRDAPTTFDTFAAQMASTGSMYIRMDTPLGTMSYDGTSELSRATYDNDVKAIRSKLKQSSKRTVTAILKDKSSDSHTRLIYAAELRAHNIVSNLYIITPLYPDYSTLNIVRNLLVYVSAIVILVSIILSIYLSSRLTSPIDGLTKSAKEMSKGNYSVKFNGGGFTETKDLAASLNKASYEMEKTDFYQREIIANVSHDLKTPLTMIRSYAEKIIDISGDNPEKRNSDLNIIISETERLDSLVTDMMTMSRLQSNQVALNKEVFNIVEAAEDVYESFRVLNESEGFEILFHPCKPVYVLGDRAKLIQVMTNFVSNAVKYSGDNKYVDIQLRRSGRKVAFHCIDHGVGIPADEQSHVWDRYYRTSANHERDIEGTGLGLSIVKGILTLHNALYGVESSEGKGSDFWFEMNIVKKTNGKEK